MTCFGRIPGPGSREWSEDRRGSPGKLVLEKQRLEEQYRPRIRKEVLAGLEWPAIVGLEICIARIKVGPLREENVGRKGLRFVWCFDLFVFCLFSLPLCSYCLALVYFGILGATTKKFSPSAVTFFTRGDGITGGYKSYRKQDVTLVELLNGNARIAVVHKHTHKKKDFL